MTGGRPWTRGNRTADEPTPGHVGCRPVPEPGCHSQVLGVAPVLPLAAHADLAFYLALGFVVGLSAIYVSAKQCRVGKILQHTPTERIRSLAVGRTEVEGTCRDVGLTIHEPYGDRECVYRHWEIQEHRPVDDQATDDCVTVDSGTDVAPFFVEDETDRILVDTTDAPHFEVSERNSVTIEVGEGDPPPPGVASFHGLRAPTNGGR